MKFKSFAQFVNEAYGVSTSSVIMSDAIESSLLFYFEKFLSGSDNESIINTTLNYARLKTYIKDKKLWSDFPVSEFKLEFKFDRVTNDEFKRTYYRTAARGVNYVLSGSSYGFGNTNWKGYYSRIIDPVKELKDHSISICHGYEILVNEDFVFDPRDIEFQANIQSLVYHELNHSYELYKRIQNARSSGDNRTVRDIALELSLTHADVNKWGIPRDIYRYWSLNFGFMIYHMEPHEIRAKVQESSPFADAYGLSDFISKSPTYAVAKEMCGFNSDKFIEDMSKIILEYDSEANVDYVMDRLRKMFLKEYEANLTLYKELPKHNIENLRKMSISDFIKYWQPLINKSGEKLKNKILTQWYKKQEMK